MTMKRWTFTAAAWAALASPSLAQSTAAVAKNASATVVEITTYDKDHKALASGSGFVVRADGVVASNNHVIDGAYAASIALPNGDVYDDVAVLDSDKRRDLVVLKIKALNLQVSRLGDSDTLDVGQHVIAIGNPEGLARSVSDGIISAIRQGDGFRVIQTTAPISHGSSGGPLLDDVGRVIGITFGALDDGQNLNLVLPINYLKPILLEVDRRTSQTLAAYNAGHYKTAKAEAAPAEASNASASAPKSAAEAPAGNVPEKAAATRPQITGPIGEFLDKQLLVWSVEDAARTLGDPIQHRYGYDSNRSIDSDIFSYNDPTHYAQPIELNFDAKTKKLRAVYLYPSARVTWEECRRLWGDKVEKTRMPEGRKLYAYKNRRLAVLLDKDDNVINLGLFPTILGR